MKLSIIMPVYNEEQTLGKIVEYVEKVNLGKISKELIIVDDGSRDKSRDIIKSLEKKYKNIKSVFHDKNKGKGAAIRTGLKHFSGDIVTIQDGDLEYNPNDFKKMIKLIINGEADVVYGSRLMGKITGFSIPSHYYGNKFLSFATFVLYGQKITDMETCYKMMKKEIAKNLNLKANKFDIEPEITAKILRKKIKIAEIPINYNSRSFEEGKKIRWKDGIAALYTLMKYRLFD